jgi:hypothetical protein
VVDRFGARGTTLGFGAGDPDGEKGRDRLERRENRHVSHVLAAAAVARLTPDPDFEETRAGEMIACRVNRSAEEPVFELAHVEVRLRAALGFRRDGSRELGRVRRDVLPRVTPFEERVDNFSLVVRRARPRESPEEAVEIGDGVVAKEAGAIPDRPRREPAPLVNHDGVALVAESRLLDEI